MVIIRHDKVTMFKKTEEHGHSSIQSSNIVLQLANNSAIKETSSNDCVLRTYIKFAYTHDFGEKTPYNMYVNKYMESHWSRDTYPDYNLITRKRLKAPFSSDLR